MELNVAGLTNAKAFSDGGIALPGFDVVTMQKQAKKHPRWVHLGPGNIFRVFLARIAAQMIERGNFWPVTAVVPRDPRELDMQLGAHDLLSLGVTLNPDGSRDLQVIAGIGEGLATGRTADFERLVNIMKNAETTLMSFTITEKGYGIQDSSGELQDSVAKELANDPRAHHDNTMLFVTSLLLHRFDEGGAPITLMSCDNFSRNGDKLRDSVLFVARAWAAQGQVPESFVRWLSDSSMVGFPISVIDKITPRPSPEIASDLAGLGFTDMDVLTPFGPPLAGFVNTEPTEYLVVEDAFVGERPPFEDFGVVITDRQTCDDFERMKVTTCLNPLHTALAIAGCLLRFSTIDSEMRDASLQKMVERLAWNEGMPVVVDPGVIRPDDFLRQVLEVRFPNQYLPDEPARIAADTSQKMPIRFGETIKAYIARGLDLGQLKVIPLVFALWMRYLMGVADDGESFEPSSDPLLSELQKHLRKIILGQTYSTEEIHQALKPILSNPTIFGVDLYSTILGEKTEEIFIRLITGPGSVRAVIDEEMSSK